MNQKGQSLVEYLIIVALIAVGSITIMRSLGETVKVRFTNITNALQNNETPIQATAITREQYDKPGLDNFFKGAGKPEDVQNAQTGQGNAH